MAKRHNIKLGHVELFKRTGREWNSHGNQFDSLGVQIRGTDYHTNGKREQGTRLGPTAYLSECAATPFA